MSKLLKLLIVFVFCLLASVFLGANSASAAGEATTQLPADNTFIVISNAPPVPGSFSSNTSTNFLYAPANSGSEYVQINNISNGSITLFQLTTVSGNACTGTIIDERVAPGNGENIPFNPSVISTQPLSDSDGSPEYKMFCVKVITFDASIVNFKLYSSAGSRLGVYAGPVGDIGTGFFANNGSKWGETISFATPCGGNLSSGSNPLQLYDLDNGYSQVPNIDMFLVRYDRATGAYISAVPLNGDVDYLRSGFGVDVYRTQGGNFAPWNNNYTWNIRPSDGTWHADSRYELVVGVDSGGGGGLIGQNNKIRIRLPFDQIYSTFPCPPTNQLPTGTITATCAADGTGSFSIQASNVIDPDGGNVQVVVSATGANGPTNATWLGVGSHDFGTYSKVPDGSTYTVSATLRDAQTGALVDRSASAACPRPPLQANCTASTSLTSPPNAAEVGEQFTVSVTVRNTSAQYGPSMSSTTHPIGISATGITGVGPALTYGPIAPGGSQTVDDTGFSSATPGTYYIYVDIGNYDVPPAGNPSNDCSVRVIIGNKSYLKAFGGEVMAGGRFFNVAGTCPAVTAGRGGIYGWTSPKGNASDGTPLYGGSSSQLTVSSLLAVNQFYSVSNRRPPGGNTFPPKGLTMANNDSAQPWGGNYGNQRCVTNYFNDTQDSGLMAGNWNGVNFPGNVGRRQYTRAAGVVAPASTLTIPVGTQVAVFIDGDVDIRNNIEFAGGYSTWEQAPNFVMVVNGDIRIRNNVTRLDGLYIAQNNTIYTCTPTSAPVYNAGNVFSNCQNQLSINGGLIANDIRWLRLRGTVRNSAFQELLDFANGSGTWAAETVNYTPQMWLARSPLKDPGDVPTSPTPGPDTFDTYDSIKSLPPIF